MIRRRSVILGFCGLVAAPAVVRATSIMPIKASSHLLIDPGAEASARSVLFTIYGWDVSAGQSERSAEHIVSIYLPRSWRSTGFLP